jgi:hypothetical protein
MAWNSVPQRKKTLKAFSNQHLYFVFFPVTHRVTYSEIRSRVQAHHFVNKFGTPRIVVLNKPLLVRGRTRFFPPGNATAETPVTKAGVVEMLDLLFTAAMETPDPLVGARHRRHNCQNPPTP